MSDKGREAIEKIVKAYMSSNDPELEDEYTLLEDILRSHGWHHEDDVVDNKTVCQITKHCIYPSKPIPDYCPYCEINRPATIKDLIK